MAQKLYIDENALEFLRENDVLVIWKLHRMRRSFNHLVKQQPHSRSVALA